MLDILTIGDSAIDLFMEISQTSDTRTQTDSIKPEICFYHGSKIPVERFETSIAGNAINVAVGCSLLGLKTGIYTEIGNDDNAKRIIEELKSLGINTDNIIKNPGTQTDVHSIIVFHGERTIFSYHGERDYKLQAWQNPQILYYTSMGKGFQKFQAELIAYLKENKDIILAFNPGTIQMKEGLDSFKEILEYTKILFLNMEEAAKIVGEKPIEQIHIDLHKLGPKLTVITDGKNGANAFDGENLVSVNSYSDSRPVIDMTGAGDAFASGFISAIFYKKPLKEALAWGVVNSGNAIKIIGAITGFLTKDQMEETVKKIT